jgi:hypothetical protein
MRKYLSIPVILILWVIVHLDWHLARSHHHRLSMEWHEHWIVGLVTFFLLVLFCARKWPEHFLLASALNAAWGLFLGHIGEAWIEALQSHQALNTQLTPERWHMFFQFFAAAIAGMLLGILAVFATRGRHAPKFKQSGS